MARNDKENVKFQEKEKFLTQKEKKLQKAIQTVSPPPFLNTRITSL